MDEHEDENEKGAGTTYTCAINSVGTGSVCQDLELKCSASRNYSQLTSSSVLSVGIVLGTSFCLRADCEQQGWVRV